MQMTVYAGEDVEQGKYFSTAGGSTHLYSHFGNQYGGFSENWECITSIPSYITFGHVPKGYSIKPLGYLLNYVHRSFIHKSWNLEII